MENRRVIGIIAGSGDFPIEVAHALHAAGENIFVLRLRGFADRHLKSYPYQTIDMLDPQKALAVLRDHHVHDIVLAGGVYRPGPTALLSIYSAYRHRDDLKKLLGSGDDILLRGVVRFFEENGFRVLGIGEVASNLLAPVGSITYRSLIDKDQPSIDYAMKLLDDLGQYDIGQGVVIAGKRILAVEGPEGTDMMLKRVSNMQKSRRVKLGDERAILVKRAKPGQDRRVDLPAIGPRTIRAAKAAHLSGIAIAAGDVILVERAKLIADADRAGLFIHGVKAS